MRDENFNGVGRGVRCWALFFVQILHNRLCEGGENAIKLA